MEGKPMKPTPLFFLFVSLLCASAFAQTLPPVVEELESERLDTSAAPVPLRVYHPPQDLNASDYASMESSFRPQRKLANRNQSYYLRRAGYHWLFSIGFGVGGAIVGMASNWEDGINRKTAIGLFACSVGWSISVPINLILASDADK